MPELNHSIDLLDHGSVRFIDHMGGDLSISRAARVSYDAAWRAGESEGSDSRLINYLWKNSHTSPFEAVTLTFEVRAPIFVFRQWHRHRTWAYNELSARYRELPETYYIPKPGTMGIQHSSNKQMRDLSGKPDIMKETMLAWIMDRQNASAFKTYRGLLANGMPRELARSVLPLGTYSHMFCTVSLMNLFRYAALRDHDHAQMEIQVYAQAMLEMARQHVAPYAVQAFEDKNNHEQLKTLMYEFLMKEIKTGDESKHKFTKAEMEKELRRALIENLKEK